MFQRFTTPARNIVVLAQDESRSLGHGYIGTEHLLMGLLREERGLAARVLAQLDVTVDEAAARVVEIVGEGGEPQATGQIPFTPRAKSVLELALRESLSLGHDFIGTEHILLGLVREPEGVAAQVLLAFGADPGTIRGAVIGALSGTLSITRGSPEVEEVELTSPPLAPEVVTELERLRAERDTAMAERSPQEAAVLQEWERRLRWAASELVRVWQRHTTDPA